ncbi:uncharacterized protein LOC115624235 isoform X1 [Scaptodrosophila lebanonensis]|uniref:Uncharacterized protein LOC115624235 isoform X1 n=1 Tax=Drosophila lebanonensis TaxID=7225 RepID=A0A6J2TFE1_DROLE|nr:uncharacterized protein LOC115624235 isoform X1 [Scaptodrosophila lebanonensis]
MITVDACCCGCTLKQGCLFYGYWVIIVEIITWILWMIFLDFIVIFYALFYGLVYILGGIFLLCAIYKHKRNLMIVSMLITALYCVTLVATLLGIPWSSFHFYFLLVQYSYYLKFFASPPEQPAKPAPKPRIEEIRQIF